MKLRVPAISGARAGRVRLLAALLLLALPLAAAVWAFGSYSARRERSNADARLVQSLSAAGGAYENVISTAGSAANRLAETRAAWPFPASVNTGTPISSASQVVVVPL